jgi:hypothetical protein
MSTHPDVVVAHVDARLLDDVSALFWATFPRRRLGQAAVGGGRTLLLSDAPWQAADGQRWLRALDAWMQSRMGSANAAPAMVREVDDRAGRRIEILLPQAPEVYTAGASLVGPFASEGAADAWARAHLTHPWVHDVVRWHGETYADVFNGAMPPAPSKPIVG